MPAFEISFDTKLFEKLDQFALLARQDYNLGSSDDWFGEFAAGCTASMRDYPV
jgi:hypothetical protein